MFPVPHNDGSKLWSPEGPSDAFSDVTITLTPLSETLVFPAQLKIIAMLKSKTMIL
jgi:hypothetical protein